MVGGSSLSAEGTSFCEKTAIFPNEAWMAACGTHWLWARISAALLRGCGGAGSAFLVIFPESSLLTETMATASELFVLYSTCARSACPLPPSKEPENVAG